MLDTVRLRSPGLEEDQAAWIEYQLVRRTAVRAATGEELYQFTADELVGSWDNRISVQVRREEWVPLAEAPVGVFSRPLTKNQKGVCKVPCAPHVVLEGSIHKALLGHNVAGGPLSFRPAVSWFVELVSDQLEAQLPPVGEWEARRVDWAECFLLPSYEAVEEYISTLNSAVYPRRKGVIRYGRESIMSAGTTTAIKAYHKGPELGVHDRKRLRMVMEPARVVELQDLANRVLRVETSIKAKKLKADKSGKCRVVDVSDERLKAIHDEEVRRLLKEGRSEMTVVRTHREVSRRLFDRYAPAQAGPLYGTWVMLATLGETEVRKQLKRRTFFDHKKKILDAGCTWSGADVQITRTAIPQGFAPVRNNPFRLAEEDPEVTRQLELHRAAA